MSKDQYPRMIYKDGGDFKVKDHYYSYKIVKNEAEEKELIEKGWKHKPVQGDGLDEQYKLERENEQMKRRIAELEAKEQEKNNALRIEENEQETEQEQINEVHQAIEEEIAETENKPPRKPGRPRKGK